MLYLRQGATHKVVVGPVVAVGDGFTPVTTLSVATADEAEAILHDNGTVVDLSGYTFAAITTADGYYHLTLQSGISGTVGHMTVVINDDSLCLPVKAEFTIVEEAVYDALFAASAVGPLLASSNGSGLTEAGGTGDHLTAVPWNAAWDAEVESEVDDALGGGTGTALTAIPWNASWDAEVQSEVEDGLAVYDPPTRAELTSDINSVIAILDEAEILVRTTIATLASQTSFTLTAGSADNSAYVGAIAVITDVSTAAQKAIGLISAYTGATKTVTLVADPGVFTMAATDKITILAAPKSLPAALADGAGGLPVSDAGGLDLDAILADTNELQADWTNGGRLDLIIDAILADSNELQTDWADGGRLDLLIDAIDDFLDTEIAAILTDTGTTLDDFVDDLEARLTAALATKLTAHAAAVLTMTVDAGSTTTAVVFKTVEGGAPSATNDFYNGRVIIFTSGTLAGQATSIDDYVGATVTATVPALTGAPAEDVTAVIV